MATQGKCLLMPGSIDAEELTQIIVTLYEVEGRSREDGEARAEEIFKLFDEVTSVW